MLVEQNKLFFVRVTIDNMNIAGAKNEVYNFEPPNTGFWNFQKNSGDLLLKMREIVFFKFFQHFSKLTQNIKTLSPTPSKIYILLLRNHFLKHNDEKINCKQLHQILLSKYFLPIFSQFGDVWASEKNLTTKFWAVVYMLAKTTLFLNVLALGQNRLFFFVRLWSKPEFWTKSLAIYGHFIRFQN
jgi:hypothetical protein